jgi:hypothetical protein
MLENEENKQSEKNESCEFKPLIKENTGKQILFYASKDKSYEVVFNNREIETILDISPSAG